MYRLRIPARNEAHADAICDVLMAALEPETSTAGLLETERGWQAEAFYVEEPGAEAVRSHLARMLGPDAGALDLRIEVLADRDWVTESLEAMPPVFAGRFAVFGRHDRHRIPNNVIGIEIEASQAFGTGHHGTTRGCLRALDDLFKARRFRRPLDVGTGTGILAAAVARALRVPVAATDIDPLAVEIARGNAVKNGVGRLVRAIAADGVDNLCVREGAPYDLIVANILARPLVRLAPDMARLADARAVVVLSGLLTWQRREVEAAWRHFGFAPIRRLVIDNWATLVLAAPGPLTARRGPFRSRRGRRHGPR
jgi:ribosomal protein L11 methyltransferase